MNVVKVDMKWINENMKWHEGRYWKAENVHGMKLEEPESTKKTPKNPDIVHYNCPPGDTEIRTRGCGRDGLKYTLL